MKVRTAVIYGDSISARQYGAGGYEALIKQELSIDVIHNHAISASGLAEGTPDCLVRLLEDPSRLHPEAELVILWHGTNDWYWGVEAGDPESRDSTRFAGALRNCVGKIRSVGGFCIGGACYPEGHPESASLDEDIRNLKIKTDAGCEFLTTQMFFDNEIIYSFMDKLTAAGINVPVVPGIMPVTNAKQIVRIAAISGNALPKKFMRIIDRYGDNPEAMKQAGIAFATEQIVDLYAGGFNAVHVYSMNKPDVARTIQANVSKILGI